MRLTSLVTALCLHSALAQGETQTFPLNGSISLGPIPQRYDQSVEVIFSQDLAREGWLLQSYTISANPLRLERTSGSGKATGNLYATSYFGSEWLGFASAKVWNNSYHEISLSATRPRSQLPANSSRLDLFLAYQSYAPTPGGFGTGTLSVDGIVTARYERDPNYLPSSCPSTIIVATHGFQPGGTLVGLENITGALNERYADEIANGDVMILPYEWDGAVGSSFLDYADARANTSSEGYFLAARIDDFIQQCRETNPSYTPRIHMIGHSLGTMVNAEAASQMPYFVDQFDIIDSPLSPTNLSTPDISNVDALFDHDAFFHEKLDPARVGGVRNFYATDILSIPFTPRFGQPIGGADNVRVDGTNHNTITDFYADLIRGTQTSVPVLTFNSPANPDFSMSSPWTPATGDDYYIEIDDLPILIQPGTGDVAEISAGIWRIESNSPASVQSALLTIPEDAAYVTFNAQSDSPEGILSLRFNDDIIWHQQFTGLADNPSILAPIDQLRGLSGILEWRIDTLDAGQVVILSDAQIRSIVATAAPLAGDYNGDRLVNELDYATWRAAFGTSVSPGTGADGNADGFIDAADYTILRDNLSVVSLPTVGDYNNDSLVDGLDYAVWRSAFGSVVPRASGADGNGDGVVDAADYSVWRDNLPSTASVSTASIANVPEPTALVALSLLMFVSCATRRVVASRRSSHVIENGNREHSLHKIECHENISLYKKCPTPTRLPPSLRRNNAKRNAHYTCNERIGDEK